MLRPVEESALVEVEFVARLRAGDESAYERFVGDHAGRLLAVTRRMLGNEEDANDAVQEAFLSAFKALDGFNGSARLSTWLHRIAVNAALMKLRSQRRRREDVVESCSANFTEDGHHVREPELWDETRVECGLEREETRAIVRAAIDRLPETYRTVLLLRDIEELDTEETARALGVSPNAVKVRLHRAHQALRDLLDETFRGGAP